MRQNPGASILQSQWCNSLLFQISPSFQNISDLFQLFPKNCRFQPQKFLMTFFSHWLWIWNFLPIFAKTPHFLPHFGNLLFPPTFLNFPLILKNVCVFYMLYVFLVPPSLTMMHLCITQCMYWTPPAKPTSTPLNSLLQEPCDPCDHVRTATHPWTDFNQFALFHLSLVQLSIKIGLDMARILKDFES